MGSTFNGLIGLIILALDIWAIINVLKSGAGTGAKILWILLILLLPVLGLVIWAIAGPRGMCAFKQLGYQAAVPTLNGCAKTGKGLMALSYVSRCALNEIFTESLRQFARKLSAT